MSGSDSSFSPEEVERKDEEEQVEATAEQLRKQVESDSDSSSEELHVTYEPQDFHPDNTILVFDLHHVLMRPNYSQIARSFVRHPNKSELLKIVASPRVFRPFLNRIGKETPEKTMKDLEKEYESTKHHIRIQQSLSPLVVDICNSQSPDLATFELIKRIKASGYGIYLLSNIGIEYFSDLRRRLPEDLFATFDGFYTTNADDEYVNKPNIKIFHHFLRKFNPEGKFKHVIFIDDSVRNVNACGPCGMQGVHYKSAKQLEHVLHQQLGVQVSPKEEV